ncbi:hypothetical protein BD410DRAFT_805019 [Rickenella mellea]|uniref:Uncharacterized protein n=1 Tax=Rickenella mellea TaxID=50990 RepID=A0A4Y7PZG2_9AGAM|nr:hypothetical protein BD410DRAFT_805019 [Rickenella mellea]
MSTPKTKRLVRNIVCGGNMQRRIYDHHSDEETKSDAWRGCQRFDLWEKSTRTRQTIPSEHAPTKVRVGDDAALEFQIREKDWKKGYNGMILDNGPDNVTQRAEYDTAGSKFKEYNLILMWYEAMRQDTDGTWAGYRRHIREDLEGSRFPYEGRAHKNGQFFTGMHMMRKCWAKAAILGLRYGQIPPFEFANLSQYDL